MKETKQKAKLPVVKKSRRGNDRFSENPFLPNLTTQTKIRRVTNRQGDQLMRVIDSDGQQVAVAGFWHAQEVDKAQFVKLFINGVKAFKELTQAGTRVFELLYLEIQNHIGQDRIHLSFQAIDQTKTPISEATFYRGMKELIEKEFIAESTVQNFYFVNPDFIWNGDRLTFVKEYRLRGRAEPVDDRTLDLFEPPKLQ